MEPQAVLDGLFSSSCIYFLGVGGFEGALGELGVYALIFYTCSFLHAI